MGISLSFEAILISAYPLHPFSRGDDLNFPAASRGIFPSRATQLYASSRRRECCVQWSELKRHTEDLQLLF